MKPLLFLVFVALNSLHADPILLWPGNQLPDGWKIEGPEKRETTDDILRVSNVSEPSLNYFPAATTTATDTAVIICPGGGYTILASDHEGDEVARFVNRHGIHAFVLKYRLPRKEDASRWHAPLQDAQRAISLVRAKAAEWKINPERIGIMGFSAGGHLSAAAATRSGQRNYAPVDEADKASCRPSFCGLIYPAYLTKEKEATTMDTAPELSIDQNTPPVFLMQTSDDPVPVENTLFFYLALKKAKIPAEVHVFDKGPHGYGLRALDKPVGTWPYRFVDWVKALPLSKD